MELADLMKQDDLNYVIDIFNSDNNAFVKAFRCKDNRLGYDFLASLCHHSSDGYDVTLKVIHSLDSDSVEHNASGDRYTPVESSHHGGLAYLLEQLKNNSDPDMERRGAIVSLLNAVIMNSDKPSRIRNTLKELGVMDIIDKLRDPNISPMSTLSSNASTTSSSMTSDRVDPSSSTGTSDLGQQIREFDSLADLYDLDPGEEADRSQSSSSCADLELDLGNHQQLFDAIMKKLTGRPEVAFLNILRHMLQIETEDSILCANIWETLERLTYGAKVMEQPLEATRLLVLASKQFQSARLANSKKVRE